MKPIAILAFLALLIVSTASMAQVGLPEVNPTTTWKYSDKTNDKTGEKATFATITAKTEGKQIPVELILMSYRNFRVRDTGDYITWKITVCGSHRQSVQQFLARL